MKYDPSLLDFLRTAPFEAHEASIAVDYDFAGSEKALGIYGSAYRQTICNWMNLRRFEPVKHSPVNPLINALILVCVVLYAAVWIVAHIRVKPRGAPAQVVFDTIGDPRERHFHKLAENYRILRRGDEVRCAQVKPSHAVPLLTMIWVDLKTIYSFCKALPSPVFKQMAKLPIKRAAWRVYFERTPTKAFFARDDYNAEHHIRHAELKRINARHVGLCHAITDCPTLSAQRRHVKFDAYLVPVGPWAALYEKTWPKDMKVITVSPFDLPPGEKIENRGDGIAVFIKDTFQRERMVDLAFCLAIAFPERKIYIKQKRYAPIYVGESGIEIWTAPTVQLMPLISHSFSDPSNVLVECLRAKIPAWCVLLDDRWRGVYWNRYGLVVKSAGEALMTIDKPYPWDTANEALGPCQDVYIAARREMGL